MSADSNLDEIKEYYENRQLKRQDFYKNGKPEGESKRWYPNGQLFSRSFYLNGKLEGDVVSWYGD